MSTTNELIGLTGRKGSGKDTAASILIAQGYENVKFAGALKDMLRCLLAYQGVDAATIERMIEGDLKEVPTDFLCGQTPRYAMQTLGTEWGRDLMGKDFWLGTTRKRLFRFRREGRKVIITDVRFHNERDMIEEAGGVVVGIVADWIVPKEDDHESERLIDALIARLPDRQKIRNRAAALGETVDQVIADFRDRFRRLVAAV